MTSAATVTRSAGTVPAMRFALQVKAAPPPPPGGAPPAAPSTGAPAAEPSLEDVESHEWAGDLYEEGDETDPAQAFAGFAGQEGEEAWLDRSEDGTLTGWVRDADGSTYRYSDPHAWATDVDDAGMTRTSAAAPGEDDEPMDAAMDDPMAEDAMGDDTADVMTPDAVPGEPAADDGTDPFGEDAEDDVEGDLNGSEEDLEDDVDELDDEDEDEWPPPPKRKPR